MTESSRVVLGAALGALCGAAAAYLVFTEEGRRLRDRIEPAIDDLRRELSRFEGTIEKVEALATDGIRVMEEFKAARGQYSASATSH